MRIDDKNTPGIGASNVGGVQGGQNIAGQDRLGTGASREAGAAGSSDRIQLSGLASQLRALQPGSEAREAELTRLRDLVASGRYQVDAEAVSRALVDEALEAQREGPAPPEQTTPPVHNPPAGE